MPAFNFTRQLLSVSAITGSSTGKWFRVPNPEGQEYIPLSIVLSAGTATVAVEGATEDPVLTPPAAPVSIVSVTSSQGAVGAYYPYMRATVTNASAADAKVTVGGPPVKQIEP